MPIPQYFQRHLTIRFGQVAEICRLFTHAQLLSLLIHFALRQQ